MVPPKPPPDPPPPTVTTAVKANQKHKATPPDPVTKKSIQATMMQAKQTNPLKAAFAATPTANQNHLQAMILQISPLQNYT